MTVAPPSPSLLYQLAIANGVSPSEVSASPPATAWQTAANDVKGTVAKGFPRDGDEVLKYSFDHGKAVQTLIVGDSHGPEEEITDNLFSNVVKVIKLDPQTGEKTQYYETFTENGLGNFKASGNLTSAAGDTGFADTSFAQSTEGIDQAGVVLISPQGWETLDVEVYDANPSVGGLGGRSGPQWGPEVFVTAPLGDNNVERLSDVEAVWMNNPPASANRSEMTTDYQEVDLSEGSFTSKLAPTSDDAVR